MGKTATASSSYWYNVAYHAGLGVGPFDAFLEIRCVDKIAWAGNLTSSGTITIDQADLFGGESDQGGIQGDVDVMFGEAGQVPNAYLLSTFGSQVPAWQGLGTLVFKGGKYGANNPYPQKPSYKFQRIVAGWDTECWYPDTAIIPVANNASQSLGPTSTGWRYKVAAGDSSWTSPTFDDSSWSLGASPFASNNYASHPYVAAGGYPLAQGTFWPLNTTIWARRTFFVDTPSPFDMEVFVDNYATCWVNGHLVLPRAGSGSEASADAFKHAFNVPASALVVGANVFVMKAEDLGQYAYAALKITIGGNTLNAMNPAHILYYARTQNDMGREPLANMNDASFRTAADWYYQQNFGVCVEYDPAAESVDDFITRIEKVAGCSMSRSPVDGLWYLDIANGVYDLASLPILSDDDILDFSESPSLTDSATNSVSVEYFDPELYETLTTPPVQAMAPIDSFGAIHEQTSYPEIPTSGLAIRVATRDLRAFITPSRVFSLTTTRLPYAWRVGTYFRLQSVKRGIADMVCMLSEKSTGTLKSGAITITGSQDIYSLPATAFVNAEQGVDTRPSQIPVPIVKQAAFEAPYIVVVAVLSRADMAALPTDVGFLMAVATDPAIPPTSLGYALTVSIGAEFNSTANGAWCANATLTQSADYDDVDFTLVNGYRLDMVAPGMGALWGTEIVRVDAIDPGTGAIVLGRGCADTVPVMHDAGEQLWFYATAAAADQTEYVSGESIAVKLLTKTGSRLLDPALATPVDLDFGGRVARPYPPAQLRINGEVAPISSTGAVTVSGAHRDRVLQADQLIDSEQPGTGPEAGTTYNVRYYVNGTLAFTDAGLTVPASTYTPTTAGIIRVEVESARDGLSSYQMHVREFTIGLPLQDETGALITTEDDQIIIMG